MNRTLDPIKFIRHADPSKPFVVAQLGQSLDGRIALPSGESRYINGAAALDHLHRIRAAVDAVIVGAGTVLADDPLLTVRRVAGENPVRVIIDPNGRLGSRHRCLALDGTRVIVLRKKGCEITPAAGGEAIFLDSSGSGFECRSIVSTLFGLGLRRILVEGGATTVSRFFEERQLDRLHLLLGPVFLGAGVSSFNLSAPSRLSDAIRVAPDIYPLDGGDILLDCDLRAERKAGVTD